MRRPHRVTFSCVVAAALVVACSGKAGFLGGPYVAPAIVQFNYETVTPQTVQVAPGGNVNWENTAPETRGFVVFPESIASSFRCTDLKPYFVKRANVYRSLPLTDEESERVQLPCALAPGSYDYEIWLVEAGFGDFGDRRPEQILRAKIVVE